MAGLARSLWLARAWSALPLLAFLVVGAGMAPTPLALLALIFGIVVEVAAAAATWGLVAALKDGTQGEIMLRSGEQVPVATFRRVHRAELAELVGGLTSVGLVGSSLIGGAEIRSVLVLLVGLVAAMWLIVLGIQRRASRDLIEAVWSLQNQRLDRAERLIGRCQRSSVDQIRKASQALRTDLLLRQGQPEAAGRACQQGWDGTLDETAAALALIRLGLGDPKLAEQWRAHPRSPSRYERYLTQALSTSLAIHKGQWELAIEAASAMSDIPPHYTRQITLLHVAALQGGGRSDEGRRVLATLRPGLADERWRASSQPRVWQLLEDLEAGRASGPFRTTPAPTQPPAARTAPAGDAFAPPERDAPLTTARKRPTSGAIPFEGIGFTQSLGPYRTTLRLAGAGTLLTFGPLLLLLTGLIALVEPSPLFIGTALIGVLATVIGAGAVAEAVGTRLFLDRPVMVLGDGRWVSKRFVSAWSLLSLAPLILSGLLFSVVLPVAEGSLFGTLWTVGVGVPFGALYVAAAISRWRLIRVSSLAHFSDPGAVLVMADRWRGARFGGRATRAKPWVALARLWTGDAAGAEQELKEASLLTPELADVLGWFRAARGEVDLDHVLAEGMSTDPGDRYRRAVLAALAALRAGQPGRVVDRLDDWTDIAERMPNRFGGLLNRLIVGVRRGANLPESVPSDPDLAWVSRVWPFVP